VVWGHWKRLGVQLLYLPSEFTSTGTLAQALDFGSGPVIGGTTPISSDIKVAMTLANVEYDLLGQPDMDWGVGLGIGKVDLDIGLMPEIGPGKLNMIWIIDAENRQMG